MNYALSLAVLSLALAWRSRAALFKGACMGLYGAFILGRAGWSLVAGTIPEAYTMAGIGALALLVNVAIALMLFAYREGDANMRSVWLCSRNDAIGNIAVIGAAASVGWLHSGWPDALVAVIMGLLALTASVSVMRQARQELQLVR